MSERIHSGVSAIVTGGASGIGRATSRLLAAEGARVCVADLDSSAAKGVVKEIEEAGGEAFAFALDVSDPDQNAAMVAATVERFGGVGMAHLNAGIAIGSSIHEGDLETFDRVIAVNLRGVFLGMRAVVAPMIEAGRGAIVATASIAGLVGGTMMPSYYASKHGVVGLVKSAAGEFAQYNVRVNAVCPGVIDTPILGPAHGVDEITEVLGQGHLLNRVGQPEEVAQLVSFLASDRASFMTGGAYTVDGGMTATIGGGMSSAGDEDQASFRTLMEGLRGADA
jgi:NAD(P)-dependent dehydrogenase (short-subunit alcohol dehydrogenase family)